MTKPKQSKDKWVSTGEKIIVSGKTRTLYQCANKVGDLRIRKMILVNGKKQATHVKPGKATTTKSAKVTKKSVKATKTPIKSDFAKSPRSSKSTKTPPTKRSSRMISSVNVIDQFLQTFGKFKIRDLHEDSSKRAKALALVHKYKASLRTEAALQSDDSDAFDDPMIYQMEHNEIRMSNTKHGKFQYILSKYGKKPVHISGPDNNDDLYPVLDMKLEKAKWKCEMNHHDNLEDCMTDTTGDYEFYANITQRSYDKHIGYWIITRALNDILEGKTADFMNEMKLFEFEFDTSDTFFDLIKSLYEELPIESMEY